MIEVNYEKIKKAEIVVGIPSYNEADNIYNVVKTVDLGILKYFKGKKAVIINADNNSSDDTKGFFLNTETETPKIYISTSPEVKGKGNNLRNLFSKIIDLKARAAMTVDADLKSISPEWVKCLLGPILKGYDYLTPIYHRHKYDGSITNHLCYPIIFGLLGYDIRQPIGGDTGFSKKMVRYWLEQKWPEPVKDYGIDIFMTLFAIKSKGKLGQVDLGSKIHKPSAPKLGNMFLEVVETLLEFLSENRNLWQTPLSLTKGRGRKKVRLKKPLLVCRVKTKPEYPEVVFKSKEIEKRLFSAFRGNYKILRSYIPVDLSDSLERMFIKEKSLKIDNELWSKLVYQLLLTYQISPDKKAVAKLLRVLYFGRMISFIKETSDKSDKEAEKLVQKQARNFLKNRNYLLSLIS